MSCLTMFYFMLSILLTSSLSLWTFSTTINIVLDFLPEKMRSKMPPTCKVIVLWLCCYATMKFHAVAHDNIFHVVTQEAKEHIFYKVSWGAATKCCVARSNDEDHIIMSYCNEQVMPTTFFTSYHKGANNDTTIQTHEKQGAVVWGWNATIKCYALLIARMTTTSICYMLYHERSDNKGYVSCPSNEFIYI